MSDTAVESADGFGLDKDARLANERREEAAARREEAATLEPEFPWPTEPFDPAYFS